MTDKRELYKPLKEKKIFWKYCLGISQAFGKVGFPKECYEIYYQNTLKYINTKEQLRYVCKRI